MNAEKEFAQLIKELYLAREFLVHQKGQRKDPEAPNYLEFSWSGFCAEIGIPYQAANNWLKKTTYLSEKESPNGRATLLFMGSVPPGFAAAVWWPNKQRKKAARQALGAAIGGREIEVTDQRRRA